MKAQLKEKTDEQLTLPGAWRSKRYRALKAAKIVTGDDSSTINCTIRNISEGGALLQLAGLFQPPPTFDLLMISNKKIVRVEKAWQKHVMVGVRFLEDPREVGSLQAFGLLG